MLHCILGIAIGVSVNEFDEMKNLEVMTFRRSIMQVCRDSVMERENKGDHGQAIYVYPPDVNSVPELPPHIREKLDMGNKLYPQVSN